MKRNFFKIKSIHKKPVRNKFEILSTKSPFIYKESYKSVRTNLDFTLPNIACKKIVITSASVQEGKSSFTINLATSLAENGERVLIIDCDLRKPVIHKYLQLRVSPIGGLTTAMKLPELVDDVIITHPNLHFDVLFAGKIPPNPAELLGTANMKAILDRLSEHYDYILCDTPPASLMSDAAILSRYADGVILVVKHKYASFEQVKMSKKNLEAVNANILGVVLNHYDIKDKKQSNASYYSAAYGYATGQYD